MKYDYLSTDLIGTLTLVADEKGLRRIAFETAKNPIRIKTDWQRAPAFFKEAKAQLTAYLSGDLKTFDLPLAPEGTDFQKRVWQALMTIPYGAVKSYGWIARKIGNPKAVRAVGGANGKNPLPIVIPCHRVIGSNGSLTGFGGGLALKQRLIELEKRRVFQRIEIGQPSLPLQVELFETP